MAFTFKDIKPSDLPVTLRGFRTDNGEKVWEEVITELPIVLEVPPLAKEHGCPVRMTLESGDGTIVEAEP
ncbi:MAG: hypothetical protein WBM00_01405 [Solirubrobacterales bacterium]